MRNSEIAGIVLFATAATSAYTGTTLSSSLMLMFSLAAIMFSWSEIKKAKIGVLEIENFDQSGEKNQTSTAAESSRINSLKYILTWGWPITFSSLLLSWMLYIYISLRT
jgi:hypothetical protein